MSDFSKVTPPLAQPAEKPKMIIRFCNAVISWTILTLVFLVPLFFLPWTAEVSEFNKQTIIFIGAIIAGLSWLGKMLAERRFEYRRTIVNAIVILFLGVYAISSLLSNNVYLSLTGDFGQAKSGFFTVLSLAILYFVVINTVQTEKQIRTILRTIIFSGFFVALIGLLQGLGLFIFPFEFAKVASFNTIGTAASLGIYLTFIIALSGGVLLYGHGEESRITKFDIGYKVFVVITSIVSLFIVASIDYWPVTVCLLVSSALMIAYSFIHARSMKGLGGILLPTAALIVSLMLIFFRFPVSLGYPSEVMPSMKASANIAGQSLRENALFGSGPGTFIYDYSKYRSVEINETAFWNVRFDRGTTRFLTLLTTIGLLGTLSWLLVSLFLLGSAAKKLLTADERTWHILIGMFSAWFLLVISKFLYSSTLSLEFVFWIMMALLVVVHKHSFYSVRFERSPRAAMVVSFVFILGLVFAVSGLFVQGQRYFGEVAYTKAIQADASGTNIDQTIEQLAKASNLNQKNDAYIRNLALAVLAKSNSIMNSPMDLEKEEEETDEDYQARQRVEAQNKLREASALAGEAVNIAKTATEIAPNNIANWVTLATVYEGLMGVTENAEDWALQSWEKAIVLEPNNPTYHTNLGKIYMVQADMKAGSISAEATEEEREKVQDEIDELLGKAVDLFNKSIELKNDYAGAHFNLGLALDRQGKLQDAISSMESVIRQNPQDVGVGFQLALLYFRNEQKDQAIKLMESVIRLEPKYANAHWYLSAMYNDVGNKEMAIKQLETLLEIDPGNSAVLERLDQLKGIGVEPPAEEVPAEEGPEGPLPEPVDVEGEPVPAE